MKIRDHRDPLDRVVDVFSVYWFGDETYFLDSQRDMAD
jgi:hypothetical protein